MPFSGPSRDYEPSYGPSFEALLRMATPVSRATHLLAPAPRPAKVWRILDWGGRGTQGELKNVGLLSKLFGSLCMQFGEHDVYQGSYRPLLPGYRASLSNLLQTWIKCYIEPHTLYSTNQVTWLNKTKLDILHLHIKVKADKLQIIHI